MDTATVDQAYGQLHGDFQDVAGSIQTLAEKLQNAAQAGDQSARERLGAGIGLGEDIINSIF